MNEMPRKTRALANVTVTIEPELLRQVKVKAAAEGLSVSQVIANSLWESGFQSAEYRKAMKEVLGRKPKNISSGKPYPKREERYDPPHSSRR